MWETAVAYCHMNSYYAANLGELNFIIRKYQRSYKGIHRVRQFYGSVRYKPENIKMCYINTPLGCFDIWSRHKNMD
jgi:hypothetical protein